MKDKPFFSLSIRLAVCLIGLSLVQETCYLPAQRPWAPDIVYVGATTTPARSPTAASLTSTTTPTTPPPAPTQTLPPTPAPSPTRLAFYDMVSFTLDPALASGTQKTVYKEEATADIGWPEYVSFRLVQYPYGVRFITYYVQNAGEAANNNIFYTYQGITSDGSYHIAVFLPVAASILADKADDTHLIANFLTYTTGITRKLNALSPAGFTPNLNMLDALVQSTAIK